MKIKLLLYTCMLSGIATTIKAQSYQDDIETFKTKAVTWDLRNAALLKGVRLPNAGEAQLGYFQDNGAFKHPLEAATRRGMHFNATRAHSLNNWDFYGSFDLKAYNEKEVPKTAMANPFRDNPYQVADSLSGEWIKQHYVLSLKAAAPALMNGKLVIGLGLDYEVLTGARQKDPRPLDNASQLGLAPGLVYQLNKKSFLGLNGAYQHYREDLSVELYNYRLVYNAYKLLGLAEYQFSAPVQLSADGITRTYTGNQAGGDLQYGYKGGKWNLLAAAGYRYHEENVTDGTLYPQKAGQHTFHEYTASAVFDWKGKVSFHQLALSWKQRDINNREYHQVQNSSSKQYETVYSTIFNTALKTRASLVYLLNRTKEKEVLSWTLKAGIGYTGLDNRYANPQSLQIIDKSDLSLAFAKYIHLEKGASCSFELHTSYEFVFRDWVVYNNKDYSSNYVAQQIFYPVHGFLTTPSWNNQLAVQYTFPKFAQSRSQAYIKGTGYLNTATAGNTWVENGSTRQGFQLSIGLYN